MAKGLASIETRRLVLGNAPEEKTKIPKRYWCYDSLSKKERCCFWHFIFYPNGGPERNGIFHPLYEYEIEILKTLDEAKTDISKRLISIYKATGIGITEFFLLWIIWKCYTDEWFQEREAMLITGPNIDLAKSLITRIRNFLLKRSDLDFTDGGAYELMVNNCTIKAYPSNNINAARGKPRVSIFFGDEAAFFKMLDDKPVRTVGERYMGKGGTYTVWVSTPSDDTECFHHTIMKETDSKYQKFHFYEEAGLKKDPKTGTSIYSEQEIEVAKTLPTYEQEYLGQWGYAQGDIYNQMALDTITAEDYMIEPDKTSMYRRGFVDPGFGTSEFGIVIVEKRGGIPYVIFSKSYHRKSFSEMLETINQLSDMFHVRTWGCDAANPEVIKDMRDTLHLTVSGYAFNKFSKLMTANASEKVAKLQVRIHKKFERLVSQLQRIRYKKDGKPDKTKANPFDEGDAFQGALWMIKMGSGHISFEY